VLDKINIELIKAKEKHPHFADSLYEAVCILCEETGEVAQSVYDYNRENGSIEAVETELAQVGAVVVRFLRYVERYKKSI